MIKLFRNIRKNLLEEGKTTKYFKYAIGEIFLVVIGILIAENLAPSLKGGFSNIELWKKDKSNISGMHDGATPSVFRNAAKLRESMTEPELKLWNYLKTKAMGFKLRRQHPIAGYILDFYCHKLRLSIEVDGGYHLTKEQLEIDKERTKYLKNIGISEIRYTNHQVLNEFEDVMHDINSKLRAGSLSCIRRGFFAERNAQG